MNRQFPTIKEWDKLSENEMAKIIENLKGILSPDFQFKEIRNCELGDQKYKMLIYTNDDSEFVFIPGGEITLGYDRDQPYKPNKAQEEDWKETEKNHGDILLDEFLDMMLTPLRTVNIKPFLIEVEAKKCECRRF